MKSFFSSLFVLALLISGPLSLRSQTTIDMKTDYIEVTQAFAPDSVYKPLGSTKIIDGYKNTYSSDVETHGLHFKNGTTTYLDNDFTMNNLHSSLSLGAWGAGTKVVYRGNWKGAGGNAFPSIVLMQGGRLVFDSTSTVDLILSGSYYTRQFWVHSDGTGVLEFDKNFKADLTQNGTVEKGLGSVRLSNCRLLTHSTQSLPMGYRPNITTGVADINSHLVFENAGGSVWQVATQDQDYKGGMWCGVNISVQTDKNLILSGVATTTNASVGGVYTNYGGVAIREPGVTVTKTGPATLTITGEQRYDSGAKYEVRQGTFLFHSKTYDPNIAYPSWVDGSAPHLSVSAFPGATLGFIKKDTFQLINLSLNGAKFKMDLRTQIELQDTLSVAANSSIRLQGYGPVSAGDTFKLFKFGTFVGQAFSDVFTEIPGQTVTWDTSKLYTQGYVTVKSVSGIQNAFSSQNDYRLYPNPSRGKLYIESVRSSSFSIRHIKIMDASGKTVLSKPFKGAIGKTEINTSGLSKGVYYYRLLGEERYQSGTFIKE